MADTAFEFISVYAHRPAVLTGGLVLVAVRLSTKSRCEMFAVRCLLSSRSVKIQVGLFDPDLFSWVSRCLWFARLSLIVFASFSLISLIFDPLRQLVLAVSFCGDRLSLLSFSLISLISLIRFVDWYLPCRFVAIVLYSRLSS